MVCDEFDVKSLLQVRRVVTSSFAITCLKLAVLPCQTCCKLADFQSKIAATVLQTKTKIAIWVSAVEEDLPINAQSLLDDDAVWFKILKIKAP
ncbi:hypothetical protein AVEN_105084-1 [Araneus ventricosus]|uniref:Uncharacterized protein n=1 Tax=Araneus ventricosus TaxID=182803 RepID=A0A4Y2GNS4_ARAVE|nr:hypothetical protein AVEN_105084-1 [Araneus ventricosus]